jgi:hypothetical protein
MEAYFLAVELIRQSDICRTLCSAGILATPVDLDAMYTAEKAWKRFKQANS